VYSVDSVLGLFITIPKLQISAEFDQLSVNRSFENPIYLEESCWYPELYLDTSFSTERNYGI